MNLVVTIDMPARNADSENAVCPYCGAEVGKAGACPECKGLLEPLSRQASQNEMGPWYVRDSAHPFRPGCNLETLRMLVERGRITRDSVVRGPTTGQFWRRASGVPGISHLLGACYSCRAPAGASDAACSACGASFAAPDDRQTLGLGSVRLLPGQADASKIAAGALSSEKGTTALKAVVGGVARERVSEILPVEPVQDDAPPPQHRSGLTPEQRAAKLAAVEAQAKELLAERRARAQGRMTVIGVVLGIVLLAMVAVIFVAIPGLFSGGTPAPVPGAPPAGSGTAPGNAPGGTTPPSRATP